MYSHFKLAIKYLHYYFTASNGKGHGVHSPFVFDFIKNVLNDRRKYPEYIPVENRRKELLRNKKDLSIEDHGAGSTILKNKKRSVAGIASTSLKPAKFGKLLFRIVKYYKTKQVLELGTSLGITTAYLSQAAEKVNTIEGSEEIASVAADFFNSGGLNNISLHQGTFETLLQPVVEQMGKVDLAFIDGNHRYQPTMEYFRKIVRFTHENSILVFDDIHWSAEMEAAWKNIKEDESVTLTIDLFFIGLVFFRKDFKRKQHFTIRF